VTVPRQTRNIIPKEGDEREFLFVVQIVHDAGDLVGIRTDLDDLHGDVPAVRGLHAGCKR
jgi:hypothetical protein